MPRCLRLLSCAFLLASPVACDNDESGPSGDDGGGGGDTQEVREVTLVATEYAFSPNEITAEPGERIRVIVQNDGTMDHSIELELPDGEVELEDPVPAGESGSLTLDVPDESGEFVFYCPLENHRELGMTGTLRVAVAGVEPAITVEPVDEGYTAPVAIVSPPDATGRLFVADQVGVIYILDDTGTRLETPFLDISDRLVDLMEEYDERGLLGLAFSPQFESNGLFYVYYSAPLREEGPEGWDHTNVIAELRVSDDDDNVADPESLRVILENDHPQFNHNGGTLAFAEDGNLFISIGDGGNAADVGLGHVEGGNAQSLENLLGKILRIDVRRGEPYAVPDDNPFVDEEGAREEIFAYGFRNPYRFSFDPRGEDNVLIVADAGQDRWEEVSVVDGGDNYGWPLMEGTHCYDQDNPDEEPATCADVGAHDEPLEEPVLDYANAASGEEGLGRVVIGGFLYRGSAVSELQDMYVFGDFSSSLEEPRGKIFVAEPKDEGKWEMGQARIGDNENGELGAFLRGFGEDADGEIYVLTTDGIGVTGTTGRVWRIGAAAADDETPGDETPAP
jgi:glucose/arabinose dehydrogenase